MGATRNADTLVSRPQLNKDFSMHFDLNTILAVGLAIAISLFVAQAIVNACKRKKTTNYMTTAADNLSIGLGTTHLRNIKPADDDTLASAIKAADAQTGFTGRSTWTKVRNK